MRRSVTVSPEHPTAVVGWESESQVTEVIFDIADLQREFGPGTVHLKVRRPGDRAPYPAPAEVSGTRAHWKLTAADLARPGYGEVQLLYTAGEQLVKSQVYRFYVRDALGTAEEEPDPMLPYFEKLAVKAGQAIRAAEAAQAAADGVHDVTEELAQARQSADAARAAAAEAAHTAEGIRDISDQVRQVEASRQAAETARDDAVTARSGAASARDAAGGHAASAGDAADAAQSAARTADSAAKKADTAKTAAGTAADRSEAARQAAETAKAGAETAKSGAVTAKTDAVSAAKKAEDAAAAAGKDLGLTGAEAGQYIEVLSVDSQGRPTGWKTVPKPEGGEKPWKVLNVVEVTAEQGEYVGKVIDAGDDGVKYKDQKLTQIIGRWSAPAGESNESFYLYVNGLYPNLRDLGGFIGTNEGHGYFEVNAIATAIQVELDPIIRLRGDPCDLVKRLMGWADGNRSGIIESLNFNKNHFRVGTKMTIYGR